MNFQRGIEWLRITVVIFFDGKLISYNIVVRTFGENINLFKLPRKAKKEYKKYGLDKN